MDFDQLLRDEIADEFEHLKGIGVGTPEFKTTVDGLTRLMEKAIEIEKFDIEAEERAKKEEEAKALAEFEREFKLTQAKEAKEQAEFEKSLKLQQMEEEKRDRLIRNLLMALGILIPAGLKIWGTNKSLKFEETGTVTTIAGRGIIGSLFRDK